MPYDARHLKGWVTGTVIVTYPMVEAREGQTRMKIARRLKDAGATVVYARHDGTQRGCEHFTWNQRLKPVYFIQVTHLLH